MSRNTWNMTYQQNSHEQDMSRTHMNLTWTELAWTRTWTKTHEQKPMTRIWLAGHEQKHMTGAGHQQNSHGPDRSRTHMNETWAGTWPQFIRAGHEENANEQDMKGIIRISYDKSTYIYICETKTWDVITDLTNLIDGEFQYLSKGQKYPSHCRNYLVVLFSNVLIVTMRTFFWSITWHVQYTQTLDQNWIPRLVFLLHTPSKNTPLWHVFSHNSY